ncbi:PAS domain-containing sensor histidine kinase [Flammeovirga agarivorans]|uniref:histidine kinase n=1 Tax=Flammeovirga agarivorans TaxID=2726742 RepID=A0A7X8SJI0_9BACT|nr:PAS domain S-box protein [Flammeovirga agarivorans]NLR91268.1 PAS domain S-box protein [Flammeovirga agarivorans]
MSDIKSIFNQDSNPLAALFNAASEGIIICNKKGIIVTANPMADKIFGYEDGELINEPLEILLPDSMKKMHVGLRDGYIKNPKTRTKGLGKEFLAQRKNKEQFVVEISISSLQLDGELHVAAFINDITKRKEAEKEVIEQRQLLEYYADYAPAAITMLDKDFRYLVASTRWKKTFLGDINEEIIGKKIFDPIEYFSQEWIPIFEEVVKGKKSGIQLDYVKRRDNKTACIEWQAHPWYNNDREISGIIVFAEDVTERVENEKKVKLYLQELIAKNRELEDFAYVSSHDLQEPLRKIRAFGDRLKTKEKEKLSEKGQDYIDRMLSSAERMQQLISDLLRFSRITSKAKDFEQINLNNVLTDVISDLEIAINEAEAEIRIDHLPNLKGDSTQLRQLFQNLISNAIKFKRDDAKPIVEVKYLPEDHGEDVIQIAVKDNGIGFDQKYSDRIFQIFQRLEGRKYNGSGIGLAICKKIAQRHGGDITALSNIGKGTTFYITLRTDLENQNLDINA